MVCTAKYSPEVRKARDRYNVQKHHAVKKRGIPFEITFEEWYKIWLDSGHWNERGRGGYVMARKEDKGPYAVGNVDIKHCSENAADTIGRKRPPRTEEHLRKISIANKGKVAHNKGIKSSKEKIEKYIATRKLNKEKHVKIQNIIG